MQGQMAQVMRRLPVLKSFSDMELEVLSTVFAVKRYKGGQLLCREGDGYASFFIVVTGDVLSFKQLGGDKRVELGTTVPGGLLGHQSLIQGGKRRISKQAMVDTIVLELNRADFQRLFQANNQFAYKVLDFIITDLSQRLRHADSIFEDMMSDPARTLSSVLDSMAEVSGLLGAGTEDDQKQKAYHIDV